MTYFIILAIALVLAYFGLAAYQSLQHNRAADENSAENGEWDCPECGFHVQMGQTCIYCGAHQP